MSTQEILKQLETLHVGGSVDVYEDRVCGSFLTRFAEKALLVEEKIASLADSCSDAYLWTSQVGSLCGDDLWEITFRLYV